MRSVFFGEDHCNKCDDLAPGDKDRIDGEPVINVPSAPKPSNNVSVVGDNSVIVKKRLGEDPNTLPPTDKDTIY